MSKKVTKLNRLEAAQQFMQQAQEEAQARVHDRYPTREELWALPLEERNRRIRMALERSQSHLHEDLEGYRVTDFDEGDASE
jgi:hypothetical protein